MNKITILNDLKNELENKFPGTIKDVILFGSQLSHESRDSDYDILILLKQKTDWKQERQISDICYDIDLKYDIITDTHILSEDELNTPRGRQPVFANAISNGIHV